MKKKLKFNDRFLSTISLTGFFALALIFFYFSNGKEIKNLIFNSNLAVLEIQRPTPASQYNGWIAWWDEQSALNTLNKNPRVFKSVSPVWYRIDKTGKLEIIPHNIEPQVANLTKVNTVKLIPTITNEFDPVRTSLVLNNSDIYLPLIESLKSLCFNYNYQGLDIDWEEIDPKDQQAFTAFIKVLSETLHQADLTLAVSVHPKTGDSSDRAVVKGYDFKALSDSVDYIKIMAYDFHNQNSSPGAITPFEELTKILEYASSNINQDKIMLGLPTYGYDWETGKQPAEVVSFNEATDRIKTSGGEVKRDPQSNELVGNYKNPNEHVIWYGDAETLNKMVILARSKGIYQFSFWRIGVEDPSIWTTHFFPAETGS